MVRSLFLRNGIYTFRKMIDGKQYCRSTGFRDLALAQRRAMEIAVVSRQVVEFDRVCS